MAKTERKTRSLALYETILKLKDLDECCKFFDDLCTPTELRSLEQRFDVAVYLQQGLVYLDILGTTGIGCSVNYCQPTGQLQSAFPKQALKIQQSNDLSA